MFKDGFDLPEKHADLRHGVFGIGGNGLAMPAQNHELAAGAGIRDVEAGRAKFADEVFCTVSGKLILALTFLALFLKLLGPFSLSFSLLISQTQRAKIRNVPNMPIGIRISIISNHGEGRHGVKRLRG